MNEVFVIGKYVFALDEKSKLIQWKFKRIKKCASELCLRDWKSLSLRVSPFQFSTRNNIIINFNDAPRGSHVGALPTSVSSQVILLFKFVILSTRELYGVEMFEFSTTASAPPTIHTDDPPLSFHSILNHICYSE